MWRSVLMSNCQAFALFSADDGSCPKSVFVCFHYFLFSCFSGTKSLWNAACDVSCCPSAGWQMNEWMWGFDRTAFCTRVHPSVTLKIINHSEAWGLSQVSSCGICGWTKWHRDRFLSGYFIFPSSVSYHQCSILIHSSIADARYSLKAPLRKTHEFWWTAWTSNRTLCATQNCVTANRTGRIHTAYTCEDCPVFISLFRCFCICFFLSFFLCTVKGKAIPLQVWTGPEGSRCLRLPDFKTVSTWKW